MNKNRIEAFSDGVMAIIITIMVLEIKTPESIESYAIQHLVSCIFSYFLSFAFIGIYWNNHHHLFHLAKGINATIMWSNLNLLFWLSLVPFATKWMSETDFIPVTVVSYAILLFICGLSYNILVFSIKKGHEYDQHLNVLTKFGVKEFLSLLFYGISIPAAFIDNRISMAMFFLVSIIWIVPSKKIEAVVPEKEK
ncbi:MAG: TMEM175 family protein [Saprospiraceae bacterium]